MSVFSASLISSTILTAASAAPDRFSLGFDFEVMRIQHSLVRGCFTMTPANSTSEFCRSSCWTIYSVAISDSLKDKPNSCSLELRVWASMYPEKAHIADINHCEAVASDDHITKVELLVPKSEYSQDEDIRMTVKFSVKGRTREAFTEKNWTESYNANDVAVKIKYGIRLVSGGIRKRMVGRAIDSYRKASIFWTRNPKLVNPMKEKRVWVQVAKNFTPIIRLTEEEIRQELFDFEEDYVIKASELGTGTHKVVGEVHVSWQKHHFMEQTSVKGSVPELRVTIN